MKKLLLVCAFVLGVSAVSFAQGRQQQTPAQQVERLKTQVTGLTDDQATKATTIFTASTASRDSLVKSANGDFSSVRPAFMKLQETTNAKIKAILTPDQATAYQKVLDDRAAAMKARQQGGGN